MEYDFSKALIRCSSLYYIVCPGKTKTPKQQYEYTEQVLKEEMQKYDDLGERKQGMANGLKKAAKIAGLEYELNRLESTKHLDPLPTSAKSYLKRLYGELKYNKQSSFKDKGNKYTNKGKQVQTAAVQLISSLDGCEYIENEERLTNGLITGIPDAFLGESIMNADYVPDVKGSWDWDSFSENIDKALNPLYWWQLQGYFELTGAKEGDISYCLISIPDNMLQDEIYSLQNRMQKQSNLIDVTITQEYKIAEAALIKNLTFDEMDEKERRLKFKVQKDDGAILKAYETIPKCRDYLFEVQEKHLMGVFSDKELPMLESIEEI